MKAMILAAGLGSRLGEVGQSTPKCLVEVGGKTLLEHAIVRLKGAGITALVINLHHLGEQVRTFVNSKDDFGIDITFSEEAELLDTGGGLKNVKDFFDGEESFFLHNGDVYCEADLSDALSAHQEGGAIATLLIKRRETTRPILLSSSGELVGFENTETGLKKLLKEDSAPERAGFSGISVLSPRIFDYMDEETRFSIIDTYSSAVTSGKQVLSYDTGDAAWYDIGTPEKLERARQHFV